MLPKTCTTSGLRRAWDIKLLDTQERMTSSAVSSDENTEMAQSRPSRRVYPCQLEAEAFNSHFVMSLIQFFKFI